MFNTMYLTVDEGVIATENDCGRWIVDNGNPTLSMPYLRSFIAESFQIPQSFWQGLRDCEEGRHVDMERTLQEPPPLTQ